MTRAEEIADQVAELHARGLNRREIAEEIGCSRATVTTAAKIAGVRFDRAATEQATKAVQVDNKARRTRIARNLLVTAEIKVNACAHSESAKDSRDFAVAVGVLVDKSMVLEKYDAVDPDHERQQEGRQALDDLMDAIVNSIDDDEDLIQSAIAPGATRESVTGPQTTKPQENTHD